MIRISQFDFQMNSPNIQLFPSALLNYIHKSTPSLCFSAQHIILTVIVLMEVSKAPSYHWSYAHIAILLVPMYLICTCVANYGASYIAVLCACDFNLSLHWLDPSCLATLPGALWIPQLAPVPQCLSFMYI